jgi:hypothetical protein
MVSGGPEKVRTIGGKHMGRAARSRSANAGAVLARRDQRVTWAVGGVLPRRALGGDYLLGTLI